MKQKKTRYILIKVCRVFFFTKLTWNPIQEDIRSFLLWFQRL